MSIDALGLLFELIIAFISLGLFFLITGKWTTYNTRLNELIQSINNSSMKTLFKWTSLIVGVLMLINFILHVMIEIKK